MSVRGAEHSASDGAERPSTAGAVVLALLLLMGLFSLPFWPLLLALCEAATFGTNTVEDFCRRIGIHDELSAMYQALFQLFR